MPTSAVPAAATAATLASSATSAFSRGSIWVAVFLLCTNSLPGRDAFACRDAFTSCAPPQPPRCGARAV